METDNIEPIKFAEILLEIIVEESNDYFLLGGYSKEQITSKLRKREVAMCRYIFVDIFSNKYPKVTQVTIAKFIGYNYHQSVIDAIKMHQDLFFSNDKFYIGFYIKVLNKAQEFL